MKTVPVILIALYASATPAIVQSESCVQIRALGNVQTGILPRPDTAMLEKLGTLHGQWQEHFDQNYPTNQG